MNDLISTLSQHPLLALLVVVVLGYIALRVAMRLACMGVIAVLVLLVVVSLL